MGVYIQPPAASKPFDSAGKSPGNYLDYLLAELRCAVLRARLAQSDLEAIGIALKSSLISPEQALALCDEADCLRFVGTAPDDPLRSEGWREAAAEYHASRRGRVS
jgi:hypothetical protein